MSDHTPGPWTISRPNTDIKGRSCGPHFRINSEDWTGLAIVHEAGGYEGDPEGRANANLITAAPELYRAAERLVQGALAAGDDGQQETFYVSRDELSRLRNALAKAEGKEQSR